MTYVRATRRTRESRRADIRTDNMEREREQDRTAFDGWKYRHYFEFESVKDDKNISVRCTLCVGKKKVLSTAKNSTSNLNKHLTKRHSNVKLADKPPATTSSDGPSPAKQVKIDERPTGGLALSNTELKELVAGYIVEDMLPISTVDSEPFRRPEGCTWRCRVCFHDC